jgi:multidrug efflux pump subunit AcrB
MTVVPALTAIIRRAPAESSERIANSALDQVAARIWWKDGFSHPWLTAAYRKSLDAVFRRPAWGIAIGLALPVLGFLQARKLPEQFFPPADRDQIQIELELSSHASLTNTVAIAQQIRQKMLGHDQVERVHWFLGESAPTFYYNVIPRRKNTPRYAQALVQLEQAEGAREVIHELQDMLNTEFPGARLLVRQLEQGPPFDAPVEVRLYGPDLQRLRELGDELRVLLAQTPDVIHTRAELSEALPKLALSVDEEQARLAGLDHTMIARQLNSTLEGAIGGSVLEATEELPIRVRISAADRGQLDRVASLDLMPSADGPPATADYRGVPLSAVAEVNLEPEIATIPRFNGRRMNEVQAFITAGVLPAEVLSSFEQRLAAADFQLPPGYSFEFGGEAAKRDEAIGNLMVNVSVLLVLMVATLVLSFQSFRMAAIIGSIAALSVGLGLGALWLFGYPFGFMAIIGTMGLIGVAINDAIVVLAALREDPRAREGEPQAVRNVVIRSTRHIVATSLTTMAGFTPLVLAGGGFWPPMAIAIAGGVGGATILALYYIPSAYILAMCQGRCAESAGESLVPSEPSRVTEPQVATLATA